MNINETIKTLQDLPQNKVKFAIPDIDGVLRSKIIHKDKFIEALKGTIGFCDVVYGWDSSDSCYTNSKYTGWHSGYPDAEMSIDLESFRVISWDNDIPFFLGDLNDSKPGVCPKSLLRKISMQAKSMGFYPAFSHEFEWFNFEEKPSELAARNYNNPKPITPGMHGYSMIRPTINSEFFNSLFDNLERFGIQLEGMHSETGPGVFEAAILYDEVLKAADKAVLFKTGVKEIANQFGFIASFMAKWNDDLPGCGGHIHQSLWNLDRTHNLFFDDTDANKMSDTMKSYLAGQLHCLPYILPMYAPTVNSYKRLTEGAWAPTTITWGIDNRTTACRVINKSMKSCRIESRVPGADVNPYLAMAASLASGLYGIMKSLKLESGSVVGNGYENSGQGKLASNLGEATKLMKESVVARELFGNAFVEHFTGTREWEWREFNRLVTDWELKRYFEII